jgi:preprotein translocase subunit SecD
MDEASRTKPAFLTAAVLMDTLSAPALSRDLVGGVQALLQADMPSGATVDTQTMNTAQDIVTNRVNGLGVSEAVVQRAGNNRIVVEIPGVDNPSEALATIKNTGLLEFVNMSKLDANQAAAMTGQTVSTDWKEQQGGTPSTSAPPTTTITTTQTTTSTAVTQPDGKPWHTEMIGSIIKTVSVQASPKGGYEVAFELTPQGATQFATYTSAHVGTPLAIVLDKKVISAPTINQAITDGKGVITGNFTSDTANSLAVQLRYGALPVPLTPVSTNTVGPTLGADSLRRSEVDGAIGLGVVILFMALYYRLPGIVADLALACYAVIVFALFRSIPITLTLPGIAGFVLSVGMAVDANVLIFERLKEELRSGKTLHSAIDLGWSRAWPSIRDSNASTIITCLILIYFGSIFGASIVKGFAITLMIGVLVSLFTAIFVTRTFLHVVLDNVRSAEHPKWFGI